MHLIIAVDGPVGAGKSTLSDELARRLNILHLDTGAMYRAVGVAALHRGIDPKQEAPVTDMLRQGIAIDVDLMGDTQRTFLEGQDVSQEIRLPESGQAASDVSRYPYVRQEMVRLQRELAKKTDMVVDGRDIGTVVLPDAPVKIYLTASVEERARRRLKQDAEKGIVSDYETVLEGIRQRDLQDTTRPLDPLRKADDAVVVDSSDLDFDQTLQAMLRVVEEKTGYVPRE